MTEPRIQYAKTSYGVSIAYATHGEGPPRLAGFWRRFLAFAVIDFLGIGFLLFVLIVQIGGPLVQAQVTDSAGLDIWLSDDWCGEFTVISENGEPRLRSLTDRTDSECIYGNRLIGGVVLTRHGCTPSLVQPICVRYGSEQALSDARKVENATWLTAAAIWFALFWLGNATGRSFGKDQLNLRVVRASEPQLRGLGIRRGFFRTLGYGHSLLVPGLGFLWAIRDRRNQAWHDKVAGSIVINTSPVRGSRHAGSRRLLIRARTEEEALRNAMEQAKILGVELTPELVEKLKAQLDEQPRERRTSPTTTPPRKQER